LVGAGISDIKRRIKSIENTIKITNAMRLVSSAKQRKAKARLLEVRPFFLGIHECMMDLASRAGPEPLEYVNPRSNPKSLYIVIGGDRGLAGGFNSNLFKKVASQVMKETTIILPIGKVAVSFFEKNGFPEILNPLVNVGEQITPQKAHHVAATILHNYDRDMFSKVNLAYTSFVSTLSQEPVITQVLPLNLERIEQNVESEGDKTRNVPHHDPSPNAVFRALVPQYLAGMIFGAIVESFAAEQAARSNAMESATSSAKEIIAGLKLAYNRARQVAITKEIIEIVSGASSD
jgi:F-type H+-transporting ATPase subunit gamma